MLHGWIPARWTLYIYYLGCIDDFMDEYMSKLNQVINFAYLLFTIYQLYFKSAVKNWKQMNSSPTHCNEFVED